MGPMFAGALILFVGVLLGHVITLAKKDDDG